MKSIKGFNKLTTQQQELFLKIYTKHQSILGASAKVEYTPISVKLEDGYFRTTFKNKQWLHYKFNGTWY
ncbi:hypothetical protein [Clostridium algidicarnis]|uniref:hypothetical protein n=1 Tax=Clostridium algidicarnis TaxID=37659 RepID=UPI000496AC01|nr:hypothetical protein [Clostridium algidicarnis]